MTGPVLTVRLPWPPSVNRYYRCLCRFVAKLRIYRGQPTLSRHALSFRDEAAYELMAHSGRFAAEARLSLAIEAYPPDKRRRDLDNTLKASCDAFEMCKVMVNDAQIDKIVIIRCPIVKGGEMVVHLREIDLPWLE